MVGLSGFDFREKTVRGESAGFVQAACSDGDEVLAKHIERTRQRMAGFDFSGLGQIAGGGDFDEFEGIGGDAIDDAVGAGTVTAAASALQ